MIDFICRNGVANLHLQAPARGNALSASMVDELLQAVHSASADETLHTLLLSGEGRHLCTGFDLSDLDAQTEGDLLLRFVRIEQVLDALWRAPLRTVACAHGRTWGAGADLFAACDVRWIAADASFRFPGAGFGLVLGTRRLTERVGMAMARDWVGMGREIDATTALSTGLATHRMAESDEPLRERLMALASEPPAVDRLTQAALRQASNPTAAQAADADLAALVRSAARPGLKVRITEYSARTRAAKKP
jgi:enoyl-CoA hydratase/carnithine racemase